MCTARFKVAFVIQEHDADVFSQMFGPSTILRFLSVSIVFNGKGTSNYMHIS